MENTYWKENTVNKIARKTQQNLVYVQIKVCRSCRVDAEKQSLEFLHMCMQVTAKSTFFYIKPII